MRADVYHTYSPNHENDLVKSEPPRNVFKVPHGIQENETTTRAMFWRNNGNIGMSSLTMWMHLLDVRHPESDRVYGAATPYDVDDFNRCYLLLEAVPEWKNNLDVLKSVSPVWEKLVDSWQELTSLFEEKKYKEVYIKMKECYK